MSCEARGKLHSETFRFGFAKLKVVGRVCNVVESLALVGKEGNRRLPTILRGEQGGSALQIYNVLGIGRWQKLVQFFVAGMLLFGGGRFLFEGPTAFLAKLLEFSNHVFDFHANMFFVRKFVPPALVVIPNQESSRAAASLLALFVNLQCQLLGALGLCLFRAPALGR